MARVVRVNRTVRMVRVVRKGRMVIRVFLKRHFERKQKTQPSTQLGGT